MTIDPMTFQMTLEVLSPNATSNQPVSQEARDFFADYQRETDDDLRLMHTYLEKSQWLELKKLSHTWKGRNAQIGFRKCSWIANDLYNFLHDALGSTETLPDGNTRNATISQQARAFLERITRECEAIRDHLVQQHLMAEQ